MSVALVHYHLRPGGVTRVIERQSEALTEAGIPHVILSGTQQDGPGELPVKIVPTLNYDTPQEPHETGESPLHGQLVRAATTALGAEPDCWHLHNPTLGKNSQFPDLITGLAARQTPLILQLHDFAEDGRPENYRRLRLHEKLYPLAPQIRYLTINSRDLSLLRCAGVPTTQSSLLPNAVIAPPSSGCETPLRPNSALALYPVRGIRRKNLGEFCLLSGLATGDTSFALALPPQNSRWTSIYQRWVDTAPKLRLPVRMGVIGRLSPDSGTDCSFPNWLGCSTHLITPSIAEGFGLTFLEAAALEKPLLGRDLPEITSDFKGCDSTLRSLYNELLIPRNWVDECRLHELLHNHLDHLYDCSGEPLSDDLVAQTFEALARERHLDFGNLPEEIQLEVLPRALDNPGDILARKGESTLPIREWLGKALTAQSPEIAPDLSPWAPETYVRTYQSIYREITTCQARSPDWLDRRQLLGKFLTPGRFHFLRS